MNTEQLRAFAVLAESGSIRKASERLFVTPPAIKHSLDRLEAEIGFALFDRSSSGLMLTESGRVFLDYVDRAQTLLHEGIERAKAQQAGDSAVLYAPYFNEISVYSLVFPHALEAFKAAHPEIRFQFKLVGTLVGERFDIVNLTPGDYDGPVTAYFLERLPLCCEVSLANPLCLRESVRLEDLDACELLVPTSHLTSRMDPTTAEYLTKRCASKSRCTTRGLMNASFNYYDWCSTTGGAIIQAGYWPRRGQMTEIVPIEGAYLDYNIYTQPEPSLATRAYVEFIQDYYAQHAAD